MVTGTPPGHHQPRPDTISRSLTTSDLIQLGTDWARHLCLCNYRQDDYRLTPASIRSHQSWYFHTWATNTATKCPWVLGRLAGLSIIIFSISGQQWTSQATQNHLMILYSWGDMLVIHCNDSDPPDSHTAAIYRLKIHQIIFFNWVPGIHRQLAPSIHTHWGTWMKGFKRRAYSETNSYFPILGRQHATIRAGLLYLDDYDWGMIHQCQSIRREIVSISILSCFITAILTIQSNARSGTQQAKTIARLHPSWLLLIFYIFLSSCFKTVHFVFYG